MSKKQNNQVKEVVEKIEANEVEVAAEETKKGIGSKLLNGVKKHGKKVAAGAAVVAGGIICYALGAKSGRGSDGAEDYDATIYEFPPEDDGATYGTEEI